MSLKSSRLETWLQFALVLVSLCGFCQAGQAQQNTPIENARKGPEGVLARSELALGDPKPDSNAANIVCSAGNTAAETTSEDARPAGSFNLVPEGTVLRLYLPNSVHFSRLSPGARIEALLARPLYSGSFVAVPADSTVQVVVGAVEKVKTGRTVRQKIFYAINRAFNPLDHPDPPEYSLQLRSATLSTGEGCGLPLNVSFLRLARVVEVERDVRPREQREVTASAEVSRDAPLTAKYKPPKNASRQILLLQLNQAVNIPAQAAMDSVNTQGSALQTEGASESTNSHREADRGWHARAILLTELSARKNHEGDMFQVRLTEPAHAGGMFLSAGTLIEGHVARDVHPRWLSRPGILTLRLDRVYSSSGSPLHVSGSLEEADADASSRFVMDDEGTLRSRKPGLGAAAVDIGYAYLFGKISDDLSETPIRALGAGMSDAAVANAARYVGFGAATVFLLTRHGRDVRLPKYSEIEIDFAREPEPIAK
jgi:hypothetical protein